MPAEPGRCGEFENNFETMDECWKECGEDKKKK
jgi:hypothetical protein